MTNRIEWTSGPYSTTDGKIGVYPLFHISYSSGENPYALSTSLPLRMKTTKFATEKEAQTYAERVVRSFLKNIGAGFFKTEEA